LYVFQDSLYDIRGYTPSLDNYSAFLQDVHRKIMWSTFIDHAFDFLCDKFKRALTTFVIILLLFSCSHHCEMHATTYDKLESFDHIRIEDASLER